MGSGPLPLSQIDSGIDTSDPDQGLLRSDEARKRFRSSIAQGTFYHMPLFLLFLKPAKIRFSLLSVHFGTFCPISGLSRLNYAVFSAI